MRSLILLALFVCCQLVSSEEESNPPIYQHPPLNRDIERGTIVSQNLRFDLAAGERFCLNEELEVQNQLLVNLRIFESDGRSVGFEITGPTGHQLKELSYESSVNFQANAEYTGQLLWKFH